LALRHTAIETWTGWRTSRIVLLEQPCGSLTVRAKPRFVPAFAALFCIVLASTTCGAGTVTAETAKKCSTLTAKAFPPRVIGNPAAGSAKGNGTAEQAYFKRCLANGGEAGDDDGQK
jgi:hypothetical protein